MNSSLFYSLLAHLLIGLCLFVSIPAWEEKKEMNKSAVLWVDLNRVEVSNKTNLPPKKKESKPVVKKKEKQKPPVITPQKKAAPPPPPAPVQKAVKQEDAVPVVEPKAKPEVTKKQEVKTKPVPPAPVKPKPQPRPAPKKQAKQEDNDDLESLLTSVEEISKSDAVQKAKEKDEMSDMVDGVLEGFSDAKDYNPEDKITVSEIDYIAAAVRKHWRYDAGIENIEKMFVVLQVVLTPDGSVSSVEITEDRARMQRDKTYAAVAENARRAVWMCDKQQEESPFRKLARQHPASFRDWQKLNLRFSPLDK